MRVSSVKFLSVASWAGIVFFCLMFNAAASASTETVLYTFSGSPDGSAPYSPLVSDKKGNLYGVTAAGGTNRQGAVYEISPTPEGGWTETILHDFAANGVDGYAPGSGLTLDKAGNLYGTTIFGGAYVYGTVFQLSPSKNGSWTETILYNFTGGNDGGLPQYGSLIFDAKGNLYGTTQNAGINGYGVAFELTPSPEGEWTETVLHAFAEHATDGGYPMAVVFDKKGNLYGAAAQGGSLGRGVVFELSPSPGGSWTETILHNFADDATDGGIPTAGVVLHGSQLYGTTEHGGAYAWGTVYRLSPTKKGWKETVLHSFATDGIDGFPPKGTVVFGKAGHIYGTTYGGGAKSSGTVFDLTLSKGVWTETVLYNFTGQSDGGYPYFGVILDKAGNLYGATNGGGNGGNGVVFEVTP
jgi:uncharacterized repeat protein (TIGR03803 family)